jgi:hypothetical protein
MNNQELLTHLSNKYHVDKRELIRRTFVLLQAMRKGGQPSATIADALARLRDELDAAENL